MEQVPNIISGKDLDYLSDMFNWNYGALKNTNSSINNVQNEEIEKAKTVNNDSALRMFYQLIRKK